MHLLEISDFPLITIIFFLHPADICRLSRVSKLLNKFATSDLVWFHVQDRYKLFGKIAMLKFIGNDNLSIEAFAEKLTKLKSSSKQGVTIWLTQENNMFGKVMELCHTVKKAMKVLDKISSTSLASVKNELFHVKKFNIPIFVTAKLPTQLNLDARQFVIHMDSRFYREWLIEECSAQYLPGESGIGFLQKNDIPKSRIPRYESSSDEEDDDFTD